MRTELLGQEKNIVKVKVEFDADEFLTNLKEVIHDLTQKASIPGFRKGRIPRKILEMRFGKENIHQETLEKMLPNAIRQVIEDYDLDMLDTPSLKVEDIHEGEPVTCELTIEVRPEVELPELGDIEVERLRQKVTDEMLDNVTDELRKQHAALNPMNKPAEKTDVISVSAAMHVLAPDGTAEPAGEPYSSNIDLTDPSVRAEIMDAILGKNKGDEVSVEFDMEADFWDKALAGKRVRYDVKINEVNEKILPDINQDFFKKIIPNDVETEAEFREKMRERLLTRQEADESDRVCEKAIMKIVDRSKLDVPDSLLERQLAYTKERDTEGVKQRYNIDMNDYLSKISVNQSQYEQELRENAEASLRRTLVLDEIGRNSGVEVTKEEVEAEISRVAALYGMERAKARAYYYKNEAQLSQLESGLKYDKISKLILDKVKIKIVDKLSEDETTVQESAEAAAPGAESAE